MKKQKYKTSGTSTSSVNGGSRVKKRKHEEAISKNKRRAEFINSERAVDKYKKLYETHKNPDGRLLHEMSLSDLEKEATKITKISPNKGIKEDKKAGRTRKKFANISGASVKYK